MYNLTLHYPLVPDKYLSQFPPYFDLNFQQFLTECGSNCEKQAELRPRDQLDHLKKNVL